MVSRAKLFSQLDHMEDELRERLIPHLKLAACGKNDLVFCVTDFNTLPQLANSTDSETESLVQLGRKILALREKLGEPSDGSMAERICWYCRKWGDSGESHSSDAQALASEFLQEVMSAAAKP